MSEKFTPLEEATILACVKNGGKQSDAWRSTHPNSKASDATIHQKASRFFSQGKVRARFAELQSMVVSKAVDAAALTLEQHMEKLRELRDKAVTLNQIGPAINAEKLRGELRRFYVKQFETGGAHDFDRMSEDELRAYTAAQEEALEALEETRH